MVPSEWEIKKLGDVATITSGGTPSRKKKEYWESGNIPWITTSEIQFNKITTAKQYITELGLKNSSTKLFPPQTVLLAMYGQGKTRGSSAILEISATTNQACAAIKFNEKYNPYYYFHFFCYNYNEIRNLSNDGSQKNLSLNIIKSISIHIPPLAEQEKIAEILSTWDQAIESTEKLIANAELQKKALMQQLLTGKKRLLDENGERFSGKWEKVKLGDVAEISSGYAFKSNELKEPRQDIPVIRMSDLKEGNININEALTKSLDKNLERYLLKEGDFIFGMSGSLSNYAWVKKKDVPSYLNQRVGRLSSKENTNQLFLSYLYLSDYVQSLIMQKAAGAAQLNISITDLKNLDVIIPSIQEQQKIAEVLSTADREIELLTEKLEYLKAEKKALMQQLLTGKRRVKVA